MRGGVAWERGADWPPLTAHHRFPFACVRVWVCGGLSQEPFECLVSFICSSNNNISRITQMLQRLRQAFGPHLCDVGGEPYHAFPCVSTLAGVKEQQLRDMGFGYRARFVTETAALLHVCVVVSCVRVCVCAPSSWAYRLCVPETRR